MKKIDREEQVQEWLDSKACKRLLSFVKRICEAVKGKKNSQIDRIHIQCTEEQQIIVN